MLRPAFLGGQGEGGDARFYLADYFGIARGGSVDATEAIKRLPDNPCKYVMLANWNTTAGSAQAYQALSADSLYENAGYEIYYGFEQSLILQLFPSQNSGLLPVNNTNQICFKARPAATVKLWYAWFY